MNLNQLKIFHFVAQLQGFTRASEELCLTQPGISKHIKQLEDSFGVRLFDRLGKKVVPTQAGEILFESTKAIFKLINDAKLKIDTLKGLSGGEIKVGASFTAGTYFIPEIMGCFKQKYPCVDLLLDISLSHRVAEKVISNDLDIGIIGAPYEDDRLTVKKFRDDQLVIIISNDHKWRNRKSIKLTELAEQLFVLAGQGSGTRAVIEKQLTNSGVQLRNKIEFGNTETVKKAVLAGIGISIISEAAVSNELATGQLKAVKLAGTAIKRVFYYTYHKDKYLTNLIKAFIEFL